MFILYFLRDMLQLILSPLKGWEDVSADGFDARELLIKGFIPFVAIVALTVPVKYFFVADASIVVLIQQAVVCFIKYFVSYFIAGFVFTLYLPGCIDGEFSMRKCHTFIIYGLGLLALINLIQNCIPVELAISFVMPIYAMYILWRGLRYLSVSFNGVGSFLIMTICAIILPPYLLQYLFNLILPQY